MPADGLDATRHLVGGPSRKGQQQDALRVRALADQVSDAMRQRHGLAGTGAGDNEQRVAAPKAECGRSALRVVQLFEVRLRDSHDELHKTVLVYSTG